MEIGRSWAISSAGRQNSQKDRLQLGYYFAWVECIAGYIPKANGEDLTNQEIAEQLVIEVGTVKNHIHNVLTK